MENLEPLKCIEINGEKAGSKNQAKACVIWLHGLGAYGEDFVPLVDQLKLPDKSSITFIFPSAPTRPVTINQGIVMPAWFDIMELSITAKEDDVGIKQSNLLISNLIEQQIANGIPANKIVLGGFSQGGALAMYAGLRFSSQLASVIGLSAYCSLANTLSKEASSASKNTPVLLCHGIFDPVVPLHLGEKTKQVLTNLNYQVQFKTYPIQHTVSLEEINYLSEYLTKILALTK